MCLCLCLCLNLSLCLSCERGKPGGAVEGNPRGGDGVVRMSTGQDVGQ